MSTNDLSPALSAFLRSIEPRARVLARAQVGPALEDERLLEGVRRDFVERVARLPPAEWPVRYWGLLLNREDVLKPSGATPEHPLYQLGPTRRLALLMRLVVGLEPAGAAKVLGLSETAYRALCRDAEDRLEDLGVGAAVLVRWQEGFQREIKAEAAAPVASSPAPSTAPAARMRVGQAVRPRRLQWGLGLAVLLLAGLFVATFFWPPAASVPPSTEASGPAALEATAASPPERDLGADLVVDPDFALLAAPAAAPWREGVGFLSWWAVEQGIAVPAPAAEVASPGPDWASLDAESRRLLAAVESAWPALDARTRGGLVAQAARWSAMEADERGRLVERYRAWLERPALERSAERSGFAAWQALDAAEQSALESAAAAFAALPAAEQQGLRAAFAALEAPVQQDWVLGPRLGRQMPGLRPLLMHLPAMDQAVLIEALDGLDAATREALAARLAGMGAADRAALRSRLLAVDAAARAALLAEMAAGR